MQIAEFFNSLGFGPELVTFIVSMIPVVELRGAIPVGAYFGLPVWEAAVISLIGNMIPVPFIIAFIRVIFDWMRKHVKFMTGIIDKLEQRANKKSESVKTGEFIGLLLFVGIPLPGTGAWTGALIAAMLNMRLKRAIPPIFLGVIVAGIIVSLATAGVVHLVF